MYTTKYKKSLNCFLFYNNFIENLFVNLKKKEDQQHFFVRNIFCCLRDFLHLYCICIPTLYTHRLLNYLFNFIIIL